MVKFSGPSVPSVACVASSVKAQVLPDVFDPKDEFPLTVRNGRVLPVATRPLPASTMVAVTTIW